MPVPSVSVDSVYVDRWHRDSVYVRDSVFVNQWVQGDTVYRDRVVMKYAYKDRWRYDTVAVLRADNSVIPENPAFRAQVLGTTVTPQGVRVGWEPCRPFPETDGWFETVWAEYRTGKIYG